MKNGLNILYLAFLSFILITLTLSFVSSIIVTGYAVDECTVSSVIHEGETQVFYGRTISIEFMDSSTVRMNIQGEITNRLHVNNSETLYDGKIITIKALYFSEKVNETGSVTFTLDSCHQEPTCTDSDGGKNYSVYGEVYTQGNSAPSVLDVCSGSYLYEGYCTSSGGATAEKYLCPYGCLEGVCLPAGAHAECLSDFDCPLISLPPENYRECNNASCEAGGLSNCNIIQSCRVGGGSKCIRGECITSKTFYDCQSCPNGCENGACIQNPALTCNDSDGGYNIYAKGKLYWKIDSGEILINEDYCTGDYITEYGCKEGESVSEVHTCPNGCENGACKAIACGSQVSMDISKGGNYLVKVNSTVNVNNIIAMVREISWALQGDTLPKIAINGDNAQVCYIHAGEECAFYYGPATHPISKNLKIKANSITTNENSPSDSTACITVIPINETTTTNCANYHYSTCPSSCTKTCIPSSCSGGVCTKDCDGEGSCKNKENETQECTDSDGGINYYSKGNLIDPSHNANYWDSCIVPNNVDNVLGEGWTVNSTGNYLIEYYCGDSNYQYKSYQCPNGCRDGECIQQTGKYCSVDATQCNLEWKTPVCGKVIYSRDGSEELCEVPGNHSGSISADFSFNNKGCSHAYTCSDECSDGNCLSIELQCTQNEDCPSLICSHGKCITEVDPIERDLSISNCVSGCFLNDKCYPMGYRKSGEYCSDNYVFLPQTGSENVCDNNFECKSNLCIDSQCVNQGLFQKLLNWFKSFGRRSE